jgi:hypothetical protein
LIELIEMIELLLIGVLSFWSFIFDLERKMTLSCIEGDPTRGVRPNARESGQIRPSNEKRYNSRQSRSHLGNPGRLKRRLVGLRDGAKLRDYCTFDRSVTTYFPLGDTGTRWILIIISPIPVMLYGSDYFYQPIRAG